MQEDRPLKRAAQYLRMSTEHQKYSIANQKEAIAEFARSEGYDVVRSYEDAGRSGLSLQGRTGLQRLLSDVLSPCRDFSAILVLDVSRWGRFQDPDQAAHYEFLCRQAGVRFCYCAEVFEGADPITGGIMKNLKRIMAAEFSREHSAKLSRAHLHGARLGFKQGGGTSYGFRRRLIDQAGEERFDLAPGEHKALKTDRVIFVPGPPEEVAAIRKIFDLYVRRSWTLCRIARFLNDQGVERPRNTEWKQQSVRAVLTNKLCIGYMIYNRTTKKLQTQLRTNPVEAWITVKVMSPLVSEKLFRQAAIKLKDKSPYRLTDADLLTALRRLVRRHGHISIDLLNASSDVPDASTYRKRFGSLKEAGKRIGFERRLRNIETGRRFTKDDLLKGLSRLQTQHGYLTTHMIDADADLPSASAIALKFGNLLNAYKAVGAARTRSEIMVAAYERQRKRGGPLTPRTTEFCRETLLLGLRRLLNENGYLNGRLIREDERMPHPTTVVRAFGSLREAYALIGTQQVRRSAAA